ncbi:MAG TPA: extracellular solute-binding protein [Clostridiales bacterium]|nr:extracellular solute-binding protein [Clostridiales bacterium]HOL91069.1 extracellular solute-binding protein [Clostridiales bacterium]
MSRGLKKLLALSLVTVMMVAVIAGCGQKTGTTPTDTTPDEVEPAPAEQTPSEPADEEPEPEPEEIRDLGGRVIKVAAWWDLTPQGGTPSGDRQVARREEMEQKYNFKFEYVNVPWDQTVETYSSSVMAGDPFADIATLEDNWVIGLANSGFVTELDSLFDFTDEKWDQVTKSLSTINGKTYGMGTGKWWPRGIVFYNKNIFEREGLENPYELMKNGQWTWEKLEEIARKATKDTNNDGKIDQWGLGGMDIDCSLVISNGSEFASIVDGKAKLNFREPAVLEAFNFYQRLCKEGIIFNKFNYEAEEIPWDLAANVFKEGKIAMFWYQYWKIDDFRDNMADDYGLVLPPIGPSNTEKKYYCMISGHNFQTIPKNVKNVEDIAFIWNKWTEPFPEDLEDPDAWMEPHMNNVRDQESLEVLKYMYDNNCGKHVGLFGAVRPAVELWWGGQDDLLKGEKTVAQIIDEKYDAIQAALDDFLANK